ncbi:hypothetical protein [Paraburkholderia xenovorans]|uniref:hypothetical protein n=1 Tax=Paraburkholderia xenovorans TaxID=36873 RepID=UPI0038B7B2A5
MLAPFDGIDVLVNNMGGTIRAKPYEEYEEARIEAEVRRPLFSTLWSCCAVLPTTIPLRRIRQCVAVAYRGLKRRLKVA